MHTVVLTFTCKAGMRDLLVQGLQAALPDTRGFEGCEIVEVYTSPDDPNLVYLWEKWRTRADQEKYLKWRTESGSMAAMGAILDGPAQFLHLDHHADI